MFRYRQLEKAYKEGKAKSIGGIEFGDNVQIGPHVTIVTDNHDLAERVELLLNKKSGDTLLESMN